MELLIGMGVFCFTVLACGAGYFFLKKGDRPEFRKVHERLVQFTTWQRKKTDILKKKTLSEIPWLNDALRDLAFVDRLKRLLDQAGVHQPLSVFLLLSGLLFAGTLLISEIAEANVFSMLPLAGLLATVPFLYLDYKKKKRMEKFERLLPDGLELVARSLRAGHAFTGGLKLVAEEMDDPVGTEFRRTLDEINYGASVSDALTNLTRRTDCEDLRFFVVAVIIQRETGGNLAEILENLARLIKERFKFQGKVRALSAEGKLSAVILTVIPFAIGGILSVLNPGYMQALFSDPIGKVLMIAALIMIAIGVYVMKKMVTIKA